MRPNPTVMEIAVIGALTAAMVALAAPVISAARLSKDARVCLDNERKLSQAMLRYVDDHDGVFPNPLFDQTYQWKDALAPALKISGSGLPSGASVLRCPSNPAGSRLDSTGHWPRSYALNGALSLGRSQATDGKSSQYRTTDFPDPAGILLILESRNSEPELGPWMIDGVDVWSNPNVRWQDENTATGRGCFHHHEKRMNLVMVDGHAVSASLPRTIQAPQMWSPWQPPNAYESKLTGMLPEYK